MFMGFCLCLYREVFVFCGWVFVCVYGSLSVSMGLCLCLWVFVCVYGSLSVSTHPGSVCLSVAVCLCLSVSVYVCICLSLSVYD